MRQCRVELRRVCGAERVARRLVLRAVDACPSARHAGPRSGSTAIARLSLSMPACAPDALVSLSAITPARYSAHDASGSPASARSHAARAASIAARVQLQLAALGEQARCAGPFLVAGRERALRLAVLVRVDEVARRLDRRDVRRVRLPVSRACRRAAGRRARGKLRELARGGIAVELALRERLFGPGHVAAIVVQAGEPAPRFGHALVEVADGALRRPAPRARRSHHPTRATPRRPQGARSDCPARAR